MIVMTLLLGMIAFLPGYFASVEERLHKDARFRPLSIMPNLIHSKKARPFLTWFGMILLIAGLGSYISFGIEFKPASEEPEKAIAALGIIGVYFTQGFSMERNLRIKRGCFEVRYHWFSNDLLNERLQIAAQVAKSIAVIVVFFAAIIFTRRFLQAV